MKNIIVFIFGFAIPGSLIAAEQSVLLSVPGMNCPVCPITIKKSLQKIDGVSFVSVDDKSKTATVTFDDQQTAVSALQKATRDVGYSSQVIEGTKP